MRILNKLFERRQSYTDLIVQARLDTAVASGVKATVTAAVEACVGLWERSFAVAETDMLDAPALAQIGRGLLIRGEHVILRIDGVLVPASHWSIHGAGPNPSTWRYRVDVPTPDGQVTVNTSGASVFHARIGVGPDAPWRGYSPLAKMPESIRLLANVEKSLADELSGPVGHVIPVPNVAALGTAAQDIQGMDGRVYFGETTATGFGVGPSGAPHGDWRPVRIGPSPDGATIQLREQASATVLAACGVPVELIRHSEGGGAREAWRRFLHGTISPVGAIVAAEARRALGASGAINFDALFASDLAGRSRAYQSLTGAGMDKAMAREICGF